jgi:hypothetical protein
MRALVHCHPRLRFTWPLLRGTSQTPALSSQYNTVTRPTAVSPSARPTGGKPRRWSMVKTPPHRSCAAYRNRAMPVFDSKSRYAPALDGARNPPRRETRSQQTFGMSWWVYQRHPTSRLLLHLSGVGPPSAAALRCPEPTTCCRLTLHPHRLCTGAREPDRIGSAGDEEEGAG